MKICVLGSCGYGRTTLSAFDRALGNIGIHNYNLITLSSIIPLGSEVRVDNAYTPSDAEYGHRLYVVMAEQRSAKSGSIVGAALGWYQDEDRRGVFVEHTGTTMEVDGSDSLEHELTRKVSLSLQDLCAFRGVEFRESRVGLILRTGIVQDSLACCALTVAVYGSECW